MRSFRVETGTPCRRTVRRRRGRVSAVGQQRHERRTHTELALSFDALINDSKHIAFRLTGIFVRSFPHDSTRYACVLTRPCQAHGRRRLTRRGYLAATSAGRGACDGQAKQ